MIFSYFGPELADNGSRSSEYLNVEMRRGQRVDKQVTRYVAYLVDRKVTCDNERNVGLLCYIFKKSLIFVTFSTVVVIR